MALANLLWEVEVAIVIIQVAASPSNYISYRRYLHRSDSKDEERSRKRWHLLEGKLDTMQAACSVKKCLGFGTRVLSSMTHISP